MSQILAFQAALYLSEIGSRSGQSRDFGPSGGPPFPPCALCFATG